MNKDRVYNWVSVLRSVERGDSSVEKRLGYAEEDFLKYREGELLLITRKVRAEIDRANKLVHDEQARTEAMDAAYDALIDGTRLLFLVEMYNEEHDKEKTGEVFYEFMDLLDDNIYDRVFGNDV